MLTVIIRTGYEQDMDRMWFDNYKRDLKLKETTWITAGNFNQLTLTTQILNKEKNTILIGGRYLNWYLTTY